MKVIIAGSRGISDINLVYEAVRDSGFVVSTVISGAAPGVDRKGEQWAKENGVPVERYPADWSRYGKRAGFFRNAEMAKVGGALIAITNGSLGTANMISNMRLFCKPVFVLVVKEPK